MGGVIARERADCQQDCAVHLLLGQSARAAARPTTATYAGKEESPMAKSRGMSAQQKHERDREILRAFFHQATKANRLRRAR